MNKQKRAERIVENMIRSDYSGNLQSFERENGDREMMILEFLDWLEDDPETDGMDDNTILSLWYLRNG